MLKAWQSSVLFTWTTVYLLVLMAHRISALRVADVLTKNYTDTAVSRGSRAEKLRDHGFYSFTNQRYEYDRDEMWRIYPELKNPPVSHESRLMKYLMYKLQHFGVMARPVVESADPVEVGFMMTLVQLLDFDETKQLLITNVWKNYQWTDEVLTWQPRDFGGIEDIRLPPDVVWTPDIVLYNNADENSEREDHPELLAVFYNGTVKWIPSAIYKSSCQVDMTNFPFDIQNCRFKFGSWTYDGLKVNLLFLRNVTDIDLEEYVESAEWQMLASGGSRQERKYPCCGDDPYPELIYSIRIKRRTAFYIVVLILPCLLLSCLTLVLFWFPPQRPDRTGLGMSLFSSFFVLLLILVQASPPTAHSISLLGLYYCLNMILIALSTTISAVVINMYQKRGKKVQVPQFLLKVRCQMILNTILKMQGVIVDTKYTKDGRKIAPLGGNGAIELDERGRAVIDWENLGVIVDRVFFVIYIFCIIFSLSFVFPR